MVSSRLALSLLLVAFTTLLLAQTPPQASTAAPQSSKPIEPCTVSGRVVSAAEGTPIVSARVGLIKEGPKPDRAVFATTSDSAGHFEFKQVPPGRYRFFASRAGFVGQEYQAQGPNSGAMLSLSPGQVVDDAMFRLTRAAVITGRVLDEAGEPMQGVAVSALRKETADEREESGLRRKNDPLMQSAGDVTNDRGEYRVFGLKAGEYYLRASQSDETWVGRYGGIDWDPMDSQLIREAGGPQYAPLYYPGVLQPSEAQPIHLSAGEEIQADFAMRLIRTVEVSGHVVGADGKPATHAYVQLNVSGVDTYGPQDLGASADSKGEFTIKGVAPGSYLIVAHQRVEDRNFSARQRLEVGETKLDNVVLSFTNGTELKGRITAASSGVTLEQLHVFLSPMDEDGGFGGSAQVKADGSFEIPNLADGSYVPHVGAVEPGWYMKSARMGAADVLQNGVQIERGSNTGTLEIVLSSGAAQLDGSVTQDNKAMAGASVRAEPEPETLFNVHRGRRSETDQNGNFSIPNIPPGKYKVVAKLPSGSPEVPAVSSEPQIITLGEHDHQTVQLELPKPQQ